MTKPRILIVEDEDVVAEDIRCRLEDAGYAVCGIAKQGSEAIELAKQHKPDLALLDIVLRGEVDGIAVAEEIRKLAVPFVFLTGYSQHGLGDRAKETEPFGYLIKPFEPASLLSAVDLALHKSQIDRDLKDSHEWFYTTLHSIGDGVIATDPSGTIVFMNLVAENLSGWKPQDAVGRTITEVLLLENDTTGNEVANPAMKALETGEVVGLADDTVLLCKDGTRIPVDDSGSPIKTADGTLVGAVLIFRDISKAREAERELIRYHEHLEDIVSKRTRDLASRVKLEELISSLSIDLLDRRDDDLDSGVAHALERLGLYLDVGKCAVYAVEESGSNRSTAQVSYEWDCDPNKVLPIPGNLDWCRGEVVRRGKLLIDDVHELPLEALDDRKRLFNAGIHSFAIFPITQQPDERGALVITSAEQRKWTAQEARLLAMFVQIIRSAMERQKAVAEKLQLIEDLNQANKLEAIGKLTGGIAHDFNNMLLPIIGYSDMLLDPDRSMQASNEEILEIRKAAESAAALTHQLLAFSRKQILQKEVLDLNHLIESKSTLLRRVLGEDVSIVVELDPDQGLIEADRGQMDQVMMNLCVNARDAMPDGGEIRISTIQIENPLGHSNGVGKHYVRLAVRDTGVGMAPEILDRIFDPFYTTKGMNGTGLGLSVVFGIIEQHGGWIDVQSEVGQGTRFEVFLPIVKGRQPPKSEVQSDSVSRPRVVSNERILLIEDEPSVVAFVQQALKKRGYRVTIAMSATEAYRVFDENNAKFDLIFSDAMLPDGTGMEILQELLGKHPEIKGLLSSGYTDHRALVDAARANNIAFLHKPYALAKLYEMVGSVLKSEVILAN